MKYLFLLLFFILISCSSEPSLVEQGEVLFNKTHLGKSKVIGCVSCHSIKANKNTVGPSLIGLNQRAEEAIPNVSAKGYIKQSIINPDAYIVSGYLPGVMYSHYSQELSEREIKSLVEFISTL